MTAKQSKSEQSSASGSGAAMSEPSPAAKALAGEGGDDFLPSTSLGSDAVPSEDAHEFPLEPLPFGQHFTEREHVYTGSFVATMLDAVGQMSDHFGELTRARIAGRSPVTLALLADQFQISKTTVNVHLKRGAKKSLDKKAVCACELLYLLVHWHRSRRREGCTLEFLEAQYRWLQGITQHPNLVEYAVQFVASKVEFGPAKLALLTLDNGNTYLTVASQKAYQSALESVTRLVRQCAFMHMAQQDIERCVFEYLTQQGFRDLSVVMLNEALAGMVLEFNMDNPRVLAVGTGAEAYTLSVLLQSDVPLSISQIQELILEQYGVHFAAHRISKSGKDAFLCFRAGVFGLERHFTMPQYVRQRIQSAALSVLKEMGEGAKVDDAMLERHVNARLQTPLHAPEGMMPAVGPVSRYDIAMALRGTVGIDRVGARHYRMTAKGEPTLSAYLLREKVAAWIAAHRQPITLEMVREIAPEVSHVKNGYALCSDDVLVRVGHGVFWLRELPLPDGVLFDLAGNGFELVSEDQSSKAA